MWTHVSRMKRWIINVMIRLITNSSLQLCRCQCTLRNTSWFYHSLSPPLRHVTFYTSLSIRLLIRCQMVVRVIFTSTARRHPCMRCVPNPPLLGLRPRSPFTALLNLHQWIQIVVHVSVFIACNPTCFDSVCTNCQKSLIRSSTFFLQLMHGYSGHDIRLKTLYFNWWVSFKTAIYQTPTIIPI